LKKLIPFCLTWIILSRSCITLAQSCSAQHDWKSNDLISNGDFVSYDSLCVKIHSTLKPCPDAFNSGCVASWYSSHGSPEFCICDRAAVLGAVKSNDYQWGEGIYQTLNHAVDSGKTYLLLFDCQKIDSNINGISHLSFQMTNQHFHAGTCFEMLPAPGSDIFGSPIQITKDQKHIMVYFVSNGSYHRIWFYLITEGDSISWIKISGVHLYKIENDSPQLIHDLLIGVESNQSVENEKQTVVSFSNVITTKTNLLITNPSPDCFYNFTDDEIRILEITKINSELVGYECASKINFSSLPRGSYALKIFFAKPFAHIKKYILFRE
jgi:hypothetical protein